MKYLYTSLLLISMTSCSNFHEKTDKYKFGVTLYSGEGLSSGYSTIYCDSVQMKNLHEAYVYVDGVKMEIKASDRIAVWTNFN